MLSDLLRDDFQRAATVPVPAQNAHAMNQAVAQQFQAATQDTWETQAKTFDPNKGRRAALKPKTANEPAQTASGSDAEKETCDNIAKFFADNKATLDKFLNASIINLRLRSNQSDTIKSVVDELIIRLPKLSEEELKKEKAQPKELVFDKQALYIQQFRSKTDEIVTAIFVQLARQGVNMQMPPIKTSDNWVETLEIYHIALGALNRSLTTIEQQNNALLADIK